MSLVIKSGKINTESVPIIQLLGMMLLWIELERIYY